MRGRRPPASRPKRVPTPRQKQFVAVAAAVIGLDAVVNAVVLGSPLVALVQFALVGWLLWRVWWVPRGPM